MIRPKSSARRRYTRRHPPPREQEPWRLSPALGRINTCWCGKEQNHDWPGRAEGAPHPK